MKYFFGLHDCSDTDGFSGKNIKYVEDLTSLIGSKISENDYSAASDANVSWDQV